MRELGGSAFKETRQWEQRWPRATLVTGKTQDPRPHADPSRPGVSLTSQVPRAATQPGAGQERTRGRKSLCPCRGLRGAEQAGDTAGDTAGDGAACLAVCPLALWELRGQCPVPATFVKLVRRGCGH